MKPGSGRIARYQCARYTTGGNHRPALRPLEFGSTGEIRRMFGEMVGAMKQGHWIDRSKSLVTVSMQVRSTPGRRF